MKIVGLVRVTNESYIFDIFIFLSSFLGVAGITHIFFMDVCFWCCLFFFSEKQMPFTVEENCKHFLSRVSASVMSCNQRVSTPLSIGPPKLLSGIMDLLGIHGTVCSLNLLRTLRNDLWILGIIKQGIENVTCNCLYAKLRG